MNILVVDDDRIVLSSCERVLTSAGHAVMLEDTATDVLRLIESSSFDLLLIDVIMPEIDPISVVEEIKQRWPEMPIVVMSGYPTPEIIARVKSTGASCFLAKPFTPDELVRAVDRVVGTTHTFKGDQDE